MDNSTAVHPSELPPQRTHVSVTPTSGLERALVKWFNRTKGFGFVTRGEGTEDVFVHISALERSGLGQVTQGDRLSFDIEIDRRGKFSATNLSALSE